ncbi:hypothetical protein MMC06_004365 [Schaereria dolodes]|nr:hypothetical protein [Schaereria dolodes]
MSWMDSWSRPSKHAATPPPLYLLPGGEATPYCHSCGRAISSRKAQKLDSKTFIKYCSERCRHHKPSSTDRRIEDAFVSLLNGSKPSPFDTAPVAIPTNDMTSQRKSQKQKPKGEPRITIYCSTVEALVFGSNHNPEKVFGRKKNRAKRGVPDAEEWKSVDMEDASSTEIGTSEVRNEESRPARLEGDSVGNYSTKDCVSFGAGKIRPTQSEWDVNGSVGGEKGRAERIEESEGMIAKRKQGQKMAERREMVKCAARRGCAFGFALQEDVAGIRVEGSNKATATKKRSNKDEVEGHSDDVNGETERRKKCEAVMNESVVESSYAKGDWGVRWRE